MIIGCTRMSPHVTGLVLLWALLPWTQPFPATCAATAQALLTAAADEALTGEFAAVAAQLRGSYVAHDTCRELVVAAWAWDGWQAAEAAAARGGSEASLAAVRTALASLGPPGPTASHGAYATAVLRAAAAAAQDERDEMRVWLEHARDLAARLALTGDRARWPLPIDLVDGELWARVDDHELAEASYTRALAERDSAAAWRGLARARNGRGNRDGACAAYRKAREWAGPAHATGLIAAEARGYLLVCDR
jgi:tetratricopeptide (TPR) repeat protein